MKSTRLTLALAAALTAIGANEAATATPPIAPRHTRVHREHSGLHTNREAEAVMAFQTMIITNDSPWMRIHFGEVNLGANSWIEFTSLWDDGWQKLDGESIVKWNHASAYLNGDRVLVRLYVAPGDEGVFVNIDHLTVGEFAGADGLEELRSLCGADDRVASTDNRVGRLYIGGCTAWRVTTGAFLTAGHCVDFDPDQSGPQLPDGVLDLNGVVEFNVPASLPNGTTVAANPDDQYPINTTGVQWRFDGEGQGLGKDWSVFGVFENSNTGLLPHEAYGFPFRMTRENPAANNTMRITGFGLDNTPPGSTGGRNAQNFTNQTDSGPYLSESVSGANIWHSYQVDTTGGNSGSPIIWLTNGLTVGIHTNAGCGTTTGNNGTSFEVDALEIALRTFIHTNARFVDVGHPLPVVASGSAYRPFPTVTAAVSNVPSGGRVSIVAGNYTAAAGNTFTAGADGKAMTLVAPVGLVRIGN